MSDDPPPSATQLLQNPQDHFELKKVLGRGSFGAVYYAVRKSDGEEVAVKRLEVAQEKQMNSVLLEIDIMKGVDSPQIIAYYANYYWKNEVWIIMEFMHRGALSSVLDKEAKTTPPRGFRDESRIACVSMGVLSGLLYMHRRNVVHRDIKSDNVLIGRDGSIKLADFGISRRITNADARMGTMIGTPHYLAPEVVLAENEGGYTSKVDVWSLGIVALEMADGRPPFADLNPMKVLFELANNPVCKLKDPSKWSTMFKSFTDFCCKAQPTQRPSSDHMIKHPFLANATCILSFPGDPAPSPQPVRRPTVSQPPPAVGGDDAARRKQDKRQAIQLFNRGIEKANAGQHDEAIQMYSAALELDPRHIGSLTNLGVAFINKKEYDSAITQFLLVCDIKPNDPNNFVNVGVAYANKKDYDAARQSFDRALELNPSHAVALNMRKRCLDDQRKAEERARQRSASQVAQSHFSAPPANGSGAHIHGGGGGSPVFDPNVDNVPPLVAACVQYLQREEEATNLLIFQEQGDPGLIQEYKAMYDAGQRPPLDAIGSHNVAGLLWLWCHELPEPLLTFGLRDHWIAAGQAANEGGRRLVQALAECVSMLPPGCRRVLHALLSLLAAIHTYQNAASRLGAFFAEEILWSQTAPPNDMQAARVVELLIIYYHELFHGDPMPGVAPAPFRQSPGLAFGNAGAPPPVTMRRPTVSSGAPPGQENPPFGYYEPNIVFKDFTREEAEGRLEVAAGGAYLVRTSSQPNCLSVSYKALDSGRVGHLLLSKPSPSKPGWTTDGRPKPYPTIRDLLRSLPYGLALVNPVLPID